MNIRYTIFLNTIIETHEYTICVFANHFRKKLKFGNESWPSVDPTNETLTYMNLDRHPHLMEEPFMQGVKFIESLNIRDPHEKNNW
jgi:hypothetical protein